MSEAVNHNTQGEPEYLWFTERDGAYFCFHGTRSEAETEFNDTENKELANPSKSSASSPRKSSPR